MQQVDLDELFRDCYFGEFAVGLPDDVTSAIPTISVPQPLQPPPVPQLLVQPPLPPAAIAQPPIVAGIAPPQAQQPTVGKRTAEEAGLTSVSAMAAGMAAAIRPAAATPGTPAAVTSAPMMPADVLSSPPAAAAGGTPSSGGSAKPPTHELSEVQKVERRERNREHAKRSRLRKKFLLESLQEQIHGLNSEIETLKDIVKRELPDKATELLRGIGGNYPPLDGEDGEGREFTPLPMPSGFGPVKTLMEPDYRLMSALSGSQQNFAISDPSLPDNPIVYVSGGFLELTGYRLDQVLGRNCRFLQGPGTDQKAVDVIRRGVSEGVDTSVCLLNYKADGTPFWNQFFVAALRDAENNVVNFVGVQCEVSKAVVDKHISEGKTPATATADGQGPGGTVAVP